MKSREGTSLYLTVPGSVLCLMVAAADPAYTNTINGLWESESNAGSLKGMGESQKTLTPAASSILAQVPSANSYPKALTPSVLLLRGPSFCVRY